MTTDTLLRRLADARIAAVSLAATLLLLLCSSVAAAQGYQMQVNGVSSPTEVDVAPGAYVTVTVQKPNAGAALDWVGMYAVGAPHDQMLAWFYFDGSPSGPPSGMQSTTLIFQLPAAVGRYEFRLFYNDGFTLLQTSTTTVATVDLRVNGSVGPQDVAPSQALTVTVNNGPANPGDWVGLYEATAPNTATIGWWYLNGTQTHPNPGMGSATLSFSAPVTAGQYQYRFFTSDSFNRLGTTTFQVVPCSSQVSPTQLPVSASASTNNVNVSAPGPCSWTASTQSSFLQITAIQPGSGNGYVTIAVEANTQASPRTGTATVAGQTIQVTQAGQPGGADDADALYVHTDVVGSVRMITDATGGVVSRHDYLPYGQELGTPVNPDNRLRFAGYERDSETGASAFSALDYAGARSYQSQTSRFTRPDDPGFSDALDPQSLNLYTYARNNPVRYADPSGHCVETDTNSCVSGYIDVLVLDPGTLRFFWDSLTRGWDNYREWLDVHREEQRQQFDRFLRDPNATCAPEYGCYASSPFMPPVGRLMTVYRSLGLAGRVQYVGITNNLARRAAEHLASKGIQIEKVLGGLSKSDARAVEQALIEIHGLPKNGGTLINRINSIASTNPSYAQQLQRGYDLLKSIGY